MNTRRKRRPYIRMEIKRRGAESAPYLGVHGLCGLCDLLCVSGLGNGKRVRRPRATGRSKRLGDKPLHLNALRLGNPLLS